ncbi:uncharacterized protein UTRI_00976 [Ustilago trichophora]|uniref:Uncharacterized protein n=1 Tax=Ustilago trichophora TaxID=86804 RepID=A0A5C3DVL4_9BASI|nr:uncharacterized protein UTRI_00976 [Ustilago trichophora]
MPTATRRKETAPPLGKRRPSAAARSESGYSRRSSMGSFKTANGASSDYAPGGLSASEIDDDDDDDDAQREEIESDNDATMIRSNSNRDIASDDADETETISHDSPKGLVAASADHDDAASSNDSEESPAIFNQNPSSDTSTLHKSPPTSQDDAASHDNIEKDQRSPLNSKSKPSRHELLTPDTALTPKGRSDRKAVRASHASHLTLPYQRSEAGDYLDASKRLSKMTMSSYNPRSRAPSRAASFMDGDYPDMEMRDARYRSVSERGGTRSSRLMAPASVLDFGGSARNSFQSQRGPSSRYASSYIEPSSLRSPSKRDTLGSPAAGIHHRDSDRLSITSRGTARKPASVVSKMLDADTQVYPGTRIRKYIEPQLNDAMRRVMKQFSGHNMQDHRCNGYPIAVFVGATAIDTGSIIQPRVSGAVSLYFGPGHPKNMASLLPEEDRTPSHIPNPKAPTPASLSRRAELRSAITALHTIYELYRGRACAHVCIDSAYVAKAWGTWIPTWELKGWPGEDDEEEGDRERWEEEYYERRRNQRRAYDRTGTMYMNLPDRRERERSRDGYASDGGRYRNRSSRAPQPRSRYDDRDDWLASDPYADRNRRRGGGGPPPQSPRRKGGRRDYDYSSEEDDYHRRGSRRRHDDDYGYGPYSPDRSPPRRRPMRRAPGRRLVDEDLLRELADIRYEFARVERDRQGSAHLYLIDRSNNPADRMARAVAKSEGSLLNHQDEFDNRSEIGLHVDEAPFSDDEELLDDEEEEEWLETRSRFSTTSKSTKATKGRMSSRNSRRESIISNATGRLRTSASLPSGHLRGGPRRQLDTFAEENEEDLAEDARSVRSVRTHRSERSRKSTRAERERDDYLARQEKLDAAEAAVVRRSTGAARSASRASHLAPPSASERGGVGSRHSMDSRRSVSRMSNTDLPSLEPASRRASMDTRRRVSAVRSQPDIRSSNNRPTVRSALASAAAFSSNPTDDEEEADYRTRNSNAMHIHHTSAAGPRHPRSRMMSAESFGGDYPEMDDLVPPARVWGGGEGGNGSVSSRNSIDSRRGPASPRKGLFGGKSRQQQVPQSPAASERKSSGFGLFSNRSTPSLHRAPAPEDPDYEWSRKAGGKKNKQQREWHSTTPRDYHHHNGAGDGAERSQWDPEQGTKKSGFLSRMFGRKK